MVVPALAPLGLLGPLPHGHAALGLPGQHQLHSDLGGRLHGLFITPALGQGLHEGQPQRRRRFLDPLQDPHGQTILGPTDAGPGHLAHQASAGPVNEIHALLHTQALDGHRVAGLGPGEHEDGSGPGRCDGIGGLDGLGCEDEDRCGHAPSLRAVSNQRPPAVLASANMTESSATSRSPQSSPAPSYTTAVTVEDFRRNLAAIRARIDAAAERAGRDAAEIRLLPVSKTVLEERLRTAFAAGIIQMGENKVQEAQRKSENLADLGISWSVIGHLQTNKAKNVAAFADEFQALDSLRLAEALDRRLQAAGRSLDVYVQVNSSGEPSKFGLEPDDVAAFLAALPAYSSLRVRGLMTLAAHTDDAARVRECFRIMRRLRDAALQAGTIGDGLLSMGMSGDFEAAIEGGSTCVRVGQAIFGARATPDSHYWPESSQAE
ncbi:pyridoxal phosphate enzyme, YggS family [Actinomyces naeslundii str. Howell 279]|uniref:Pyridoxal phosphate homeostasis protein n=2 Tax=Actinomyces naeslundii TaxID=1655 RepID=J3F246_ACTNH|nr:pyridoxal phosphate enzyme, YggS family [Actinomyces naeslundii str. Howell 279]